MSWFTAVLPVITLILGAVGTFLADTVRYRRTRRDLLADTLRTERSGVYLAFVEACHEAAHKLGRMAVGCPEPLERDPAAYWLIDSDVTRRLRNLQIVGGEDVVGSAAAMRAALFEFRKAVEAGVEYDGDDYRTAYRPVVLARDAFIEASRAELASVLR